jgi:hypothetical protein
VQASLAEVCRALAAEVNDLAREVHPAVNALSAQVDVDTLARMLTVKQRQTKLVRRSHTLRQELKRLIGTLRMCLRLSSGIS